MKPAMDEAVLLAVRCFHKDHRNSWEQPVHLDEVTCAVARIYRVRDNLLRILLEDEVKQKARELQGRELLKFKSLVSNEVHLTRAGSDKAASIERSQLIVDSGIVGRIQDYSRSEIRTRLREPERDRYQETLKNIVHGMDSRNQEFEGSGVRDGEPRDHKLERSRARDRDYSLDR